MASEDDYRNDTHHMRRDVRDAHSNSALAKLLSTLALITAAIALAVSIAAWNKANDAYGNAQRAINNVSSQQQTQ